MRRAFPIFAVLTAALLSYAMYEALVAAPTERTMGDVQRIFYYHVPSAWTAFLLFAINFVASVQYLARRDPKNDRIANWVFLILAGLSCVAAYLIGVVPTLKQQLPQGMYPSSIATTGIA